VNIKRRQLRILAKFRQTSSAQDASIIHLKKIGMLDLSLEDSIAEDYAVEGIRASTPVIFFGLVAPFTCNNVVARD
jgi:hypothetical protein